MGGCQGNCFLLGKITIDSNNYKFSFIFYLISYNLAKFSKMFLAKFVTY